MPKGAAAPPIEVGAGFPGWQEVFGGDLYRQSILPLVAVTLLLAWRARPSAEEEIPAGFRKFQAVYLSVWFPCAAADWLQGPYVYALYSAYDYSREEIAQLFVAGFGSSLVFSFFVGAVCDRYGRKKCAIAYCLIYIVSCLSKHVNLYWVLMIGRITGGIATSLLFSDFECWLVSEHLTRHRFSGGLLSYMFGMMYTTNYLAAIVSGVVGELLNDGFEFRPVYQESVIHIGGALGPFDLSIVCLVIATVMIIFMWKENYGQDSSAGETQEPQQSLADNAREALKLLRSDPGLVSLGLAVASFEGCMYAFVFNWSPALQSAAVPPPYGLIFALFMMACMCGASVSTLTAESVPPAFRLLIVFAIGTCAMAVSAVVCNREMLKLCFAAFCVFEFCAGVYFPAMGVLKSQAVPERVRGTIYNFYRVPLNTVVVALLLTNMSIVHVFAVCVALLAAGFLCVAFVAAAGCLPQSRRRTGSCEPASSESGAQRRELSVSLAEGAG